MRHQRPSHALFSCGLPPACALLPRSAPISRAAARRGGEAAPQSPAPDFSMAAQRRQWSRRHPVAASTPSLVDWAPWPVVVQITVGGRFARGGLADGRPLPDLVPGGPPAAVRHVSATSGHALTTAHSREHQCHRRRATPTRRLRWPLSSSSLQFADPLFCKVSQRAMP